MRIVLNGGQRRLDGPVSLDRLLEAASVPRRDVAVALDGEVVPRSRWAETEVVDGSVVDVVTAVQGG